MNVLFDEIDDLDVQKIDDKEEEQSQQQQQQQQIIPQKNKIDHQSLSQTLRRGWKTVGDHPQNQINGNTSNGIRTRMSFKDDKNKNMVMVSQMKPKLIKEVIVNNKWVEEMQEKLLQFE